MTVSARQVLASPATIGMYLFLVLPLAIGWFKTSLLSPLALPGYLIYVVGTAIGNVFAPRLDFRVYWIPFLIGCFAVAVAIGLGYELLRDRVLVDDRRAP